MQAKLQVLSYNLKQAYTVRVDLEKEGSLYKLNNKVDTQRGIVTFSKCAFPIWRKRLHLFRYVQAAKKNGPSEDA